MKYRSEIDGLRALAVVPVILFHAGFKAFNGGFVGVDVFFVISGYLITTILLNDLELGNFSIVHFYERRARRILPALFLVMFACLPFAWFWLLPQDLKSFSQSLVAVSIFASNILFWQTSGYFDTANELKPLIHTWSLSVEEQYYVLFPLFLFFSWKLGKRFTVVILALVAIISLALAQWYVNKNPAFTFYMLPTRAWELLIGAFVAFYYSEHNIKKHRYWVSELGSMIGFTLIVYATFGYSERTPFPSLYTFAPTIGAALIIVFATNKTLIGKLLSTKPFLWIGLISYSAYLWHQPLFAFARQRSVEEPAQQLLALLAAVTLPLAYLTWRFVERPFRNKRTFSRKQVFALGLMSSLFFIGVGLIGYKTNGFTKFRYTDEQVVFLNYFENSTPKWNFFENTSIPQQFGLECDFYDIPQYRSGNPTKVPIPRINNSCYTKNASRNKLVFIWGDSHAQQLRPGLSASLPKEWQILQVASSGCSAKLGSKPNPSDYCEQSNWFAYKKIFETKPDVVVVGQNSGHDIQNMLSIANALDEIGIKKIIFTGPSPHWTKDLPDLVIRFWNATPQFASFGLDKKVMNIDADIIKNFPQTSQVRYVSLIDELCNENGCQIYIGDDKKLGITSWDYGHLTPIASAKVASSALVPRIIENR